VNRTYVLSVAADPSIAVINALAQLFEQGVKPSEVSCLIHGTTVATTLDRPWWKGGARRMRG